MKINNQNEIRNKFTSMMYAILEENGEDVGLITSNCFNFPVVSADGEEGWCEITIKVTKDSGDDGYMKREQYEDRVREKAEKAKKEKVEKE